MNALPDRQADCVYNSAAVRRQAAVRQGTMCSGGFVGFWRRIAGMSVLLSVCVAGCETQRAALHSASALERSRAAVRLADARDASAVHDLVGLLDDPDDVVRMYAILSLHRLCGETFGYVYYAPLASREAAIQRWRAALREGTLRVSAASPAAAHPGDAGSGMQP